MCYTQLYRLQKKPAFVILSMRMRRLLLSPKWKEYVAPKRRPTSTRLYSATFQNFVFPRETYLFNHFSTMRLLGETGWDRRMDVWSLYVWIRSKHEKLCRRFVEIRNEM
jgi:hypothetical protein